MKKSNFKETIVFLLTLSLLCIFTCSRNKPQPKADRLSKFALSGQKKEIIRKINDLKEILSVTDTIQLETNKESLIGYITKACKHPRGYLILDSQVAKKVYLFDKHGKFISVLGGIGRGPSEYTDPKDIAVSLQGDCYVLDSRQRKIIVYDVDCNYKKIIRLHDLNIYPSGFSIIKKETAVFYNLHPDFGRNVNNDKIIIADVSGGKCKVLNHFGKQETLLKKLFYDMGSYHVTENGIVWIANVFDLGINIFNINGELLKEATEHVKLIPKPHINPEEMGRFKRPSESLDTYYSLTGLRNMAYLDSLVIAYYGNTNRNKYYCMIFDYTGEPLLPGVITTENMIPGLIVGFNHNELYCSVVSEQSGKTFANTPNPFLVVYNLKPDIE